MFHPFYLFIGRRYASVKGKDHFISVISLTSVLGIAIGVVALITVMSVMNGFATELRQTLLGGTAELSIHPVFQTTEFDADSLKTELLRRPEIKAVSGYLDGQGIISAKDLLMPLYIKGIQVQDFKQVMHFRSLASNRSANLLQPQAFGILLGQELALKLQVQVGDKVTVLLPHQRDNPITLMPRSKRFTVEGIFELGAGYDLAVGLMNLEDARCLLNIKQGLRGLELKLAPGVASSVLVEQLNANWRMNNRDYRALDWTENSQHAPFLKALQMEKRVMQIILFLIIAVASFNLVSSLVMMVTDKKPDIAILRTMGATRRQIMGVFIMQGFYTSGMGILWGVVFGLALAYNATDLVAGLESWFGVEFIDKKVYLISSVPSEVQFKDILGITGMASLLGFLATIYPAYKASHVEPAEAIRYG